MFKKFLIIIVLILLLVVVLIDGYLMFFKYD